MIRAPFADAYAQLRYMYWYAVALLIWWPAMLDGQLEMCDGRSGCALRHCVLGN
ncbi:hypothetical protein OAO87_01555 [bacterium]|nr:hypothetical protein [bacterium]